MMSVANLQKEITSEHDPYHMTMTDGVSSFLPKPLPYRQPLLLLSMTEVSCLVLMEDLPMYLNSFELTKYCVEHVCWKQML